MPTGFCSSWISSSKRERPKSHTLTVPWLQNYKDGNDAM